MLNDKIDRPRALVASYTGAGVTIHHLDRQPLPSHARDDSRLATIQELLFPGYVGTQGGLVPTSAYMSNRAWLGCMKL